MSNYKRSKKEKRAKTIRHQLEVIGLGVLVGVMGMMLLPILLFFILLVTK